MKDMIDDAMREAAARLSPGGPPRPGEVAIGLGVIDGNVVLLFERPASALTMTPDDAIAMGEALVRKAMQARAARGEG